MTSFYSYLQALGLHDEQSDLFQRLASTGPLTVLQLSQLTSVPRTTVYLYIEEMIQKGLILEEEEGKKKKYSAVSPDKLLSLLQNKKKEYHDLLDTFKQHLPEIEGIYSVPGRPRISYYEGVKGLEKLFFESLPSSEKWYMILTSPKRKALQKQFEGLFSMLDDHLIHTKELYLENHEGKLALMDRNNLRHEVLLLPFHYSTSTDMIILDQKIMIISYEPEINTLLIEDVQITHMEKMKFLALFDAYSKPAE